MTWFYESLQKGYHLYLKFEEIQELIQKFVNWYEIKYPDRLLALEEGIVDTHLKKTVPVSKELDINQLKYRLSSNELKVLECDYRGTGGYCVPIDDISGDIIWQDYIVFDILNQKSKQPCSYMISANAKTGLIRKYDLEFLGSNAPSLINIEKLYQILKNDDRYDISNLENVIFFHKTDLELRYRILSFVALALVYSKNTITPEYGYIRAKKFIDEFNKYQNIGLNLESFEDLVKINKTNSYLLKIKKHNLKRKIMQNKM